MLSRLDEMNLMEFKCVEVKIELVGKISTSAYKINADGYFSLLCIELLYRCAGPAYEFLSHSLFVFVCAFVPAKIVYVCVLFIVNKFTNGRTFWGAVIRAQ